jgi:plastocyanin
MAARPYPTTHLRLITALLIGTALCALAILPLASAAQQAPAEGVYVIEIRPDGFFVLPYVGQTDFTPNVLVIPSEATVKWENKDPDGEHSVKADQAMFDSGVLTTTNGRTNLTLTFTEPDTFKYHCTIHPEMVGTIIVTGDGVDFR